LLNLVYEDFDKSCKPYWLKPAKNLHKTRFNRYESGLSTFEKFHT
jgi:hypothetical protein